MSELEQVDWRRAADPADLREYDAFGPWIEPILSAVVAVHSEAVCVLRLDGRR